MNGVTTPRIREQTGQERDYYALNEKVYRVFAPFYDTVTAPIARLRREVVSASGAGPTSKVLDVATGTGAQARAFAERCREVVGIDISEHMLRVARRQNRSSNLELLRADATELPFGDGSFDVSCISFALHEMPPGVRERVVREMTRVTKPEGTIVLVDYGLPRSAAGRSLVYHIVKLYERERYAEFIRSDLRAFLRELGLDVRAERSMLLHAVRVVVLSSRKGGVPAGCVDRDLGARPIEGAPS
jgi:demethylmenaquinone methyltransferase/2-methoxy-6-polyprenyl-1,4-benzoquinol methylase